MEFGLLDSLEDYAARRMRLCLECGRRIVASPETGLDHRRIHGHVDVPLGHVLQRREQLGRFRSVADDGERIPHLGDRGPGFVDTNDDAGLNEADGTPLPYTILNPYLVEAFERVFVRIVPN